MCKYGTEIARNNIGTVNYCVNCEQIALKLESLLTYMSYKRFVNLYLSLLEIKENVSIYDDGNFNDEILITSPIKETYFSFTLVQVNQVLNLFEETFLMLEVKAILSEE